MKKFGGKYLKLFPVNRLWAAVRRRCALFLVVSAPVAGRTSVKVAIASRLILFIEKSILQYFFQYTRKKN